MRNPTTHSSCEDADLWRLSPGGKGSREGNTTAALPSQYAQTPGPGLVAALWRGEGVQGRGWLSTELRECRVPWEPWGARTATFKGPLISMRHRFSRSHNSHKTQSDGCMRKALAGTERLAEGKEYCLLKEFCSDSASAMEMTDPEEGSLTVPVKERQPLDGCGSWTCSQI